MRIINLLRIYFTELVNKTKLTYLLLVIETALSIAFIAMLTSQIFYEYNYKLNYIDCNNNSAYAFLSLNSSMRNNLFLEDGYQQYDNLLNNIKNINGITSVGFVAEKDIKIGSLNVKHLNYDKCYDVFKQPTYRGNWIDKANDYCVIGGALINIFNIGDIIKINGKDLYICDYLIEPYYGLDSTVASSSLSMIHILKEYENIIISNTDSNDNSMFSTLLLRFDDSSVSFDELKDMCSIYGNVYSVNHLVENAITIRNQIIKDNLPIIISMMLICILISMSGLLMTLQNNIKNYSIIILIGETKFHIIYWLIFCHTLLMGLSWSVGILIANNYVSTLIGIPCITVEAEILSLVVVLFMIVISAISIFSLYNGKTLIIYSRNK